MVLLGTLYLMALGCWQAKFVGGVFFVLGEGLIWLALDELRKDTKGAKEKG